jgi:hypothetical protein
MFLAVTGGILVGVVGIGAIYDFVARRHGGNPGVTDPGLRNGQDLSVDQAANLVHDHDFQHG